MNAKTAWVMLAAASCGGPAPRWEELIVSPNEVGLLGRDHAREVAVFGRARGGALERIALEELVLTSSNEDAAAIYGARIRGGSAGEATIRAAAGGAEISFLVTTGELTSPFAQAIDAQQRGDGDGFGRSELPGIVLGPPRGGGRNQGGTHTLSLGLGGSIALSFAPLVAYDGPGADLIVFENAFHIAGRDETYAEPAEVAVSMDGAWSAFTCEPVEPAFSGCAGIAPVLAGPGAPEVDPTDPLAAGGDAFDLAELETPLALIDRARITDAETGTITANGSGFDLDAIAIVHALPGDARALVAGGGAREVELRRGDTAPIPRFDVEREGGGTIAGVATKLEIQPPGVAELDSGLIRALAPGRATITAIAGPFTANIDIEVVP